MKFQVCLALLGLLQWTVSPFGAPQLAHAETAQLNGTQNSTEIKDPKVKTAPPKQNQQQAQENTRDLNKKGQKQSQILGMLAIAGGTAMVAKGMAMNASTCHCGTPLIIAGVFMIGQGLLGLKAAAQMGGNAGTAQGFNVGMTSITDPPLSSVTAGKPDDTGIRIDDSFLRNDKAKSVMGDLEKETGISADDFMKGFNEGKSIPEMLGETGKFGSAEKIAGAMEGVAGEGAGSGGGDGESVMEKLGLTEGDLAAMAAEGEGKDDAYALGSGGAGSSGASKKGNASSSGDLASLLGSNSKNGAGDGATAGGGMNDLKVSDNIQAALDKNGITGRTIFEMVRSQYKKKTPMMFGVTQNKVSTVEENPFANLSGAGLEL